MNDQHLRDALNQVGLRYRRLVMRRTWAVVCLGLALFGLALLGWVRGMVAGAVPVMVGMGVAAVFIGLAPVVFTWLARLRDPVWIGRRIEQQFPELDARLLAALEQKPDSGGLGFLQQMVIDEAVRHSQRNGWEQIISGGKLRFAAVLQLAMVLLFGGVVVAMVMDISNRPRAATPTTVKPAPVAPFVIKVEPEDTNLERGTALLVEALFGTSRVPSDVQLLARDTEGKIQEISMTRSLDDPRFAVRVPGVKNDMTYAVKYGADQTRWYKVGVFDYPELKQADAKLTFPEYTGAGEKLVEDTRSVTAVEGTKAVLSFHLNKPVSDAHLIPVKKANEKEPTKSEPVELNRDASDPTLYTLTMDLKQSQKFDLQLVDADKRTNRDPAQLTITVTANKPPDLKVQLPGHDVDVSPLEELTVKASVWDDFGVKRVGLTYTIAGQEPKDLVLAENVTGKERKEISQMISLESLKAQPDQLLSYHLWAEDVGPDGKPRRTLGDMFFAEVRPFEEIFRQGQQPAQGEGQQQPQQRQQQQGQQGQGQNVQRAEDLADLEKQIIAATWKIMRRETSEPLTDAFVPDVKLVGESQASAKEQAEGLGERLTDERSKTYLEIVLKDMTTAVDKLKEAEEGAGGTGPSAKPLELAMAAEQAAYQDILRMRARESEVVRNQQGQQGQQNSRNQRQQRQLNQLDLANQQNRYQQQRNAQQQAQQNQQDQNPAQREARQVASRLRELAQRQEELNRQMREAQAALQQARDRQQQEDLQRQLARLREQQQQQLRDADDLQNRLEQPQNQENMAQASQQLDQTRQNLQRASEQLNRGQVDQAQASGQRASEQLNNLREQVRQAAAGQFNEALTQMREQARQLDQNQQQVAQQLAALDQQAQQPTPGLRASNTEERQQVAQQLQGQRQDLQKLTDNMRETIQAAEVPEPLLSSKLYDTLRQATQKQPEKALDTSKQLVQQGLLPQARQTEGEAGKAITQLRQGVEQAASSVLGDGTEALRRARNEIDAAAQQLNQEVASAQGKGSATQPSTQPGRTGAQLAQNNQQNGQPGQQGQTNQNPGQGQQGQQGQQAQAEQQGDRQLAGGQQGQQGQQGAQPGRGQQGQQGQQGQGQQGDPQTGERQLANAQGGQQGQIGQEGQQGQQGQQAQGQQGQQSQAGQGQRGGNRGQQANGGQQPGQQGQGDERQLANAGQDQQGQAGQEGQQGQGQQGQAQQGQGQQGQRGQPGQGQQAQAGQGRQGQNGQGQPGQGQQARGGQQGQGRQGQQGQPGEDQQAQGGQPGQGQQGRGEQPGQGQARGGHPGQGQPGQQGQRGQGQPGEGQLAGGQGRGGQPSGQQPGEGQQGQQGQGQQGDQQAQANGRGQGNQPGRGGQNGQPNGQQQPGEQLAQGRGQPGQRGGQGQQNQPGQAQGGQNPQQAGGGGVGGAVRGGTTVLPDGSIAFNNTPAGNTTQPAGSATQPSTQPSLARNGQYVPPANLDPSQDARAVPNRSMAAGSAPISGSGFQEWSDRLRDVEEMVDDAQLRDKAARIREQAAAMRAQYKQNGQQPDSKAVQETLSKPLAELRDAITQELMRRQSAEARVPIDREPVPPAYSDQVKLYYEKLGSGK